MTASTQVAPAQAAPASTGRAGFAGTVRAEFIKIRATRSTYWTLLATIVVTVGFGALVCASTNSHEGGPTFDPTARSLSGLYISQLVIAVLGALTMTSEYATGLIRTSLTAMPRRGVVFAAKAVVFGSITLVTGLITCFGAFFLGQALLSSKHLGASLGQPGVLRAVIGGALFLTACGLLAFGLGVLLRHTAGAITAAIGLLFVLSVLVEFLPQGWQNHVNKWVPALAGGAVWATKPTPDQTFSAWPGFAVLAGYAVLALAAGLVVFLRRDA
jgi:ABC-2 type transport system permease protein